MSLDGIVSMTKTFVPSKGPLFVTVMVKSTKSFSFGLVVFAILVTAKSVPPTVNVALSESLPLSESSWLTLFKRAVFETTSPTVAGAVAFTISVLVSPAPREGIVHRAPR